MTPAIYTVVHETLYTFTLPVSQAWQLARLTPRTLPWQRLLDHAITIDPVADELHTAQDCFGNTVTPFGLHRAYSRLKVTMRCRVEVSQRPPPHRADPGPGVSAPSEPSPPEPWESVRDHVRRVPGEDNLLPARMCEPTRMVPLSDAAAAFAAAYLQPGRDWLEAVTALMRGIHREFRFKSGITDVTTSVDEVLQLRTGVCQDFAHLMLAGLRGHGLPARYMSGYLLTNPPPGRPRLLGVDATHAWVAAYSPRHGWVEFDPTNDTLADSRYITLAWGADFADVVPLRGVVFGGGTQKLGVKVSVIPDVERGASAPMQTQAQTQQRAAR